jgi:hypothetical protein
VPKSAGRLTAVGTIRNPVAQAVHRQRQQAAQVPGPQPAVRCRATDRGRRFARFSAGGRRIRTLSPASERFSRLPHLSSPITREKPRLRISIPPPPGIAEGILPRPSSFRPIGPPPICDWPEETKLRRLHHPMHSRTVPLYIPREDRELVTNARCADVDDKVYNAKGNCSGPT